MQLKQIYSHLITRFRIIRIQLSKNISIGDNCIIEKNVQIITPYGGSISIGNNCELRFGTMIASYGGDIKIGENCSFNPYCIIYGHGGLSIGNGVRIATHTIIVPSNHRYSDLSVPIYQQGEKCRGITIEDDVWIGSGAKILDGVHISKGCIIGAGTVLTKSTERYGIYAGVPGRKIKDRRYCYE